MKSIVVAAALVAAFTATAARAEDDKSCTSVEQAKWMTVDAVTEKAKAAGLDVRKVKVEGSCYEVYAVTDKGEKIEALYDPATGNQVGSEGEND